MAEELLHTVASVAALLLEAAGIVVLVASAAIALWCARGGVHDGGSSAKESVRNRFGRGMLLGLEFFVAADIIYTVTIDLTYQSVGVLAIIVLIRTLLSFTLELETTGRWPWRRADGGSA